MLVVLLGDPGGVSLWDAAMRCGDVLVMEVGGELGFGAITFVSVIDGVEGTPLMRMLKALTGLAPGEARPGDEGCIPCRCSYFVEREEACDGTET